MLNPNLPSPSVLLNRFSTAVPFKHLCIDDFLIPSVAEQLLTEFPPFERSKSVNELGRVGGKSTREDVRQLGSGFCSIDEYFSSVPFLRHVSLMTGIPDLTFDPSYFGGGTHDNQQGQELDPHIDFNFNQDCSLHRRLNLILYLNKNWEESWGGEIELHSNPREPSQNTVVSFAPIFNRCIIFETTEASWHGFPSINLPAESKNLSHKSFAIYLYTKDRPSGEVVPPHRTFYVPRPLPSNIVHGQIITKSDEEIILRSIRRRDEYIFMYQRLELELNGQIQGLQHQLREIQGAIRCETLGYVNQVGRPEGYSPDQWIEGDFKGHFVPSRGVERCELRLFLPIKTNGPVHVNVTVGGTYSKEIVLPVGIPAVVSIDLYQPIDSPFTIEIRGNTFTPRSLGLNNDDRPLLCQLKGISFYHK